LETKSRCNGVEQFQSKTSIVYDKTRSESGDSFMSCLFLDPDYPNLPNPGFDLEGQYQMVPAGGTRRMGFATPDEPEDVIIYCVDPNKAWLWGLYSLTGKAAPQGSGFLIGRNSAVRFYITGRDPRPTAIRVE